MKISVLIIIFLVYAISCTNNPCDITDYKNGKWNKIDTSISYKICSNTNKALNPNDSIQIEFLGVLKEDQKILIQNDQYLALLTLLTDIPLGEFTYKEIISNKSLSKILPAITKNSEGLIRFKLSEPQMPLYSDIVSVYFKHEADSLEINQVIKKFSALNYVDSVIYLSSETAANKFSEETDSTWKKFLNNNPLPSSSSIYIKKGLYNSSLKDSLTNQLSTETIISEISFPNKNATEYLELSTLLKFPFFVKIKS